MTEQEITNRTNQAVEYFKEGYNCAQSVAMAYADLYKMDKELLKHLAGSFGGGMGRLREMCGAATGMFMILGLEHPTSNPEDVNAKTVNYAAVQRTAGAFKEKLGSYICADLLDIERAPQSVTPDDRNDVYYTQRPCAYYVAVGASILGHELANTTNNE